MIQCGNNLLILKTKKDNTYDSCVTDAPYGLGKEPNPYEMLRAWLDYGYMEVKGKGFMNKEWDAFVPQPNFWKEIYRVLKPGAFAICFFGSRTYDWGVMAMRLAGFEIRDQMQWLYGQGMPKGRDIGKATGEARFEGWNTALKPAFEPIVVARKPIYADSVTKNMIEFGVGAYNIGASMIGDEVRYNSAGAKEGTMILAANTTGYEGKEVQGRYPTNVLFTHHYLCEFENCHQDCPIGMLNKQSGIRQSGGMKDTYDIGENGNLKNYGILGDRKAVAVNIESSEGFASRFFYCSKASSDEREIGVKMWEKKISPNNISGGTETRLDGKAVSKRANNHPTVKPLELIRYLVKLVTPKGGKVIEPFGGSGTTLLAAQLEFMDCDYIDLEQYYCDIAAGRSKAWRPQYGLDLFFNQ